MLLKIQIVSICYVICIGCWLYKKPELPELDVFMKSLGFEVESHGQRGRNFTRVYVLCHDSAPRVIEFFYDEEAGDHRDFFGKRGKSVQAYGNLKTFSTEPTQSIDERVRIIEEKKVKTEYDCYRHLAPERLTFYNVALALRNHYNALVVSEQTGEEINPDKPFPNR